MRTFVDIISEATAPCGYLYHGTSTRFLKSMKTTGVAPVSYWSDQPEVAAVFARGTVIDYKGDAVVIRVPFKAFKEALFEIDWNIIDFPIADDISAQAEEWERSSQDWRACLEIYHAVCYEGFVALDEAAVIASSNNPFDKTPV